MARSIHHLWLLTQPLVLACTPAQPATPGGQAVRSERPAVLQKPIMIGFSYEPATLEPSFGAGSGNRDMSALFSGSSLT